MTGPNAAHWRAVRDELARWHARGQRARLWLRDDDAVTVTPALVQLMEMCGEVGVTPLIAVIPAQVREDLADYLNAAPASEVAVHGWSHINHATAGSKSQEFPVHRPRQDTLAELGQAAARLGAMFASRITPIYVPPWNRIAPEVAALLPDLGFRAVSAFGRKPLFADEASLVELNTHVDVIDWRGTRGGHDPERLTLELAQELAWSRENDWSPVGILTHHLVHDAQAWQFLRELFAETAAHPDVCWCRAGELVGRAPACPPTQASSCHC